MSVIILISLVLLLGLLYFLLWSHVDKLRCNSIKTQDTTCAAPFQIPLQQRRTPEPQQRETEQNVVFSSYPLQHANWDNQLDLHLSDLDSTSHVTENAAFPTSGVLARWTSYLIQNQHIAVCFCYKSSTITFTQPLICIYLFYVIWVLLCVPSSWFVLSLQCCIFFY
jgi:hypothetical protein